MKKKKSVRSSTKPVASRKAKGKKRASLKRAGQAVNSAVRKTSKKARALIDQRLAALSPGLKNKLDEVKTQIPIGDLRSLGLNVLERARSMSEKIRQQKNARPAKGRAQARASKK